ncbi:MAG: UvrABC system protein C [Gemmatimonadales bacterium]|nr:UvrABC system protein C [bacterium HR33]GIW51082.1 MAG: UvrABC system protein C [Gemmatimonadales bacterium]
MPDRPGVYLWKDSRGGVLYVGKAKNLRQRVRSYLAADYEASPKNRLLRKLIADVDTIVVESESQALLLENNLIKEYSPRFNIRLRDDKTYPSIAVTLAEPFPRIVVGRRLNLPGARYFGPYTDVAVLRRTLQIIRRIFTVRSCSYNLPEDAPSRPCLDYHIQRCKAPCVGYQSQDEYRKMIEDVVAFLEGKTVEVRARLRQRMEEAAARLEFERAAELRNAIRWLDQLERPQVIETVGGPDADVIGFARDGDDAVGVVLKVRDGKVVARERQFLHNLAEEPDEVVLRTFLMLGYRPLQDRASEALLPFEPADLEQLAELVAPTKFSLPQRGSKVRLVELADQNARHLLESMLIESLVTDERAEDPVYALGRDLGLAKLPRSMVCIDISTNQGRDTVGSLVWFQGGRPKKAEYRRYRIKSLDTGGTPEQNDYAAIKEVVTRFVSRRLQEGKELPDLMVIDGGKGQLNAALEALQSLGIQDLAVISLAKRQEEIFQPGRTQGLVLPRRSPGLKLLQRLRDEAHRFAVTYSRKRRTRRVVTSELLSVPGIGPKRRRILLERFGSLAGVRLASPEEIAALPGFSLKLATRVLEHVRS